MTATINDNIQIATTNIDFTILKPQWDNTTRSWFAGITCTNKNTGTAPPSNELLPALKELEFIRYTVSLTTNGQVDFKVSLYPALTFKSNPSTGAAEAFWNLPGFPTDPSELLSGWIEFDKTLTKYSTATAANTVFKGRTTAGTQSLGDITDNLPGFILRISIPPLTPVNLSDISQEITSSSGVDTFKVKFKVGGALKVAFVEDLLSKNGESSYLTKVLINSLATYASSVSTTTNNISLAQALKIADFLDNNVTLNGDILEANSVATKVTVRVVNKNSGASDAQSFASGDVTSATAEKEISVICVPSDTLLVFLHVSNDAGTTSWIISQYSSYPLKDNLIITSTPRPDGTEIFIDYPFLVSQTIYFSIVYESKILGSIELGPSDTDGKSTVITNSAFQQYIPIEFSGYASFTGQALVANGVISQNTKSNIIKFFATPGASSSSAVLSLLNNVVQSIVNGVKAVSFDINKLLSVIESDNVATYIKITITSTVTSNGTADADLVMYGIIRPNSFSIELFDSSGNSTEGKAITIGPNTTSKKISLQIYNINPEYGTLNSNNTLLINTLAAATVYLRNIQNISTTLLIASLPNALNLLQMGAATIDGLVKVNGEVDGDNWDTLTVSVSILNNDETQTKVLIKQSDSTTGYYIDLLRSSFNANTFAALLHCVGVSPLSSLAVYAIVKKTYGPSITLQTKPAFAYYDPLNVLVKFSDITATSGVVTFMSNEPFGVIVYTKVIATVVTNASEYTSSTLTTTGWYRHYAKVTGSTLNLISVAASGAPIGFKTLAPADSM